MRYYGYEEFLADLKELAKKIEYDYDGIVAIARGGLTIAHMLGEFWNERRVYTINSIAYDDTKKLESVRLFNIPDLKGASKILIVDDIVDSGATIKEVIQELQRRYPKLKIDVATLFYKRDADFVPTYRLKEATEWIDFFWSRDMKGMRNDLDDR